MTRSRLSRCKRLNAADLPRRFPVAVRGLFEQGKFRLQTAGTASSGYKRCCLPVAAAPLERRWKAH
jgi:hypothetical protein